MSELLSVVDRNDNFLKEEDRKTVHNSDQWHRGVHILLVNSKYEILLQVRSPTKDKFPNCYDCSVSEHVKAGESFENAAKRGIKEELGLENIPLKKLVKLRMNYGSHDNMITEVFEINFDGELKLDESEISKIIFVPKQDIPAMIEKENDKFPPWTREIIKWYIGMSSKIEIL